MTTVAYRAGVLAADRQTGENGWINPFGVEKVFAIAGQKVAAVTGDYAEAVKLVDWLRVPKGERPSLGDNSRVIVLDGRDKLTVYEGGWFFGIQAEYAAWGSGMPAATAALIMGADARRAVEVASMVDESTSSEIDCVSLPWSGE